MKKIIKNDISQNLSKEKWYNPNSYTPLDSAVCFLVILISFFALEQLINLFFSWLRNYYFDLFVFNTIATFLTQGLLVLVVLAFSKMRKVPIFSGGGYIYKFNLVDALFACLLIFGVFCFIYALHFRFVDDIYVVFYGETLLEHSSTINPDDINVGVALLYNFILVPILPCICEEIMFRGVIMRGLEKYGAFVAVVFSGFMFAIMHGNFEQIVLQFVGGVAMGAVVYITKNFMLGAIMHWFNNFFIMIVSVFEAIITEIVPTSTYLFEAILIIYGLMMLVVSIYYFSKKELKSYKLSVLGKTDESKQGMYYAQLTTADCADSSASKVDYSVIDYDRVKLDKNNLFLYKNQFVPFNNYRNKVAEFMVFSVAIIFAIVLIFLSI